MKIRKLGSIIFFATTLVVFFAGTAFTFLNRYNPEESFTSRGNILAIAGSFFLTVAELAFIFLHGLLDARELWRRIASYTLCLGLIGTITYATYTEAKAYMEERNTHQKTNAIATLSKEQQSKAKTKRERTLAIKESQNTLNETLKGIQATDFTPFAVNFLYGLFCIVTGTLIQPREPWKRRKGAVPLSTEAKAKIEGKIGFLPDTAKAYDDGKGGSVIIKDGRNYLGSISRKEIE